MLGAGSLRCRIGWHRPRPGGRWNHGYCFTACERCDRDMVRSAFGEWHVPRDFRIVAHADARTIDRFDAAMAARDAGSVSPPRLARGRSAAPSQVAAARPAAVVEAPFDFDDFDAIDPTAGAGTPSPPRPPLTRAAP